MPFRDTPHSSSVLTFYDGHSWINETTLGPNRGSFATRDAAALFDRALARETRTTNVRDEAGFQRASSTRRRAA